MTDGDAERLAEALDRFAHLIDSIEWIGAGDSIRADERAELERLIERHPDVVDRYLRRTGGESHGGRS